MTPDEAFLFLFFTCRSIFLFFARLIRLTQISQEKFIENWKPLWEAVKQYTVYLLSSRDGLLEKILNDLNKLKPTPNEIKNKYLPIMYIDKPDDLQIILNNSNSLEKSHQVHKFGHDILGSSLGFATASRWRRQRHLISPAFSTEMLENYVHVFNRKNRTLIKELEKSSNMGETIDLWHHLSLFSFDTIVETMMGFKADDAFTRDNKRSFLDGVTSLTAAYAYRTLHLWLYPDLIFKTIASLNGWLTIRKQLMRIASKIIRHRQRMQLKQNVDKPVMNLNDTSDKAEDREREVFLSKLLAIFQSGSRAYTGRELTQEVLFMTIAGTEPICLTSCFTLLMLAMHPQIQEEVYEEILCVLADDQRCITIEDVTNMPLLDRCIKETLRLYPITPLITRKATADIKLSDGHLAKKGTTVVISPYCVHRKEEFYENASVWDPNNFLKEKVQKRHDYSFIAFSGGPRGCLGSQYAMLLMKVTLATIVKKYQLSTDMKVSDIKLKLDLILRSAAGWKVQLRGRH